MKKLSLISIFTFSFLFIFPCGWDWDTIQMEKKEFPTIHELIVGKFLRHSPELYYWRIRNRTDLLKKYPDSVHYYDDLAMAYDKTGDSKKAIEIMLKKEKLKPGLYETYANLGLFYMHNGEMEKGVKSVEDALKINPDAHFGREVYQLYLGKYILSKMKDGKLILPLAQYGQPNFYDYLNENYIKARVASGKDSKAELAKAIKGVSGMMTFANYQSPVLLEALGDLLLHTNSVGGAGHLGSRSYLKASYEVKDEAVKKLYHKKADKAREWTYGPEMYYNRMGIDSVLYMESPEMGNPLYRMDQLEIALKLEVQSAEIWYDSIRVNEMNWIKEGKNPDSMFAITYYASPSDVNPVSEYATKKRKDEVDEIFWMRKQLDAPDFIKNIHGHRELPDSIKAELDKIYDAEFAVVEPKAEEKTEEKVKESPKAENEFNLIFWMGIGITTILGALAVRRLTNRK